MLFSNFDLLIFGIALLATGAFAGIIAGLLGVGGGIVIVPVLFHIFTILEIDDTIKMHLAVGTSLATIIPTSLRSLQSHMKREAVDLDLLKRWALPLLGGVIAGSILAGIIDGAMLTAIFAVIALVVSINMAFGRSNTSSKNSIPKGIGETAIASFIGLFSTLMGIGGGTLGVPIMNLFGFPIHRAVATASGLGVLISIPGAIGFIIAGWGVELRPPFSLGYISLVGFFLIIPATILTVPFGVELAHKVSTKILSRLFSLFLALTALRMFGDIL